MTTKKVLNPKLLLFNCFDLKLIAAAVTHIAIAIEKVYDRTDW